MLAWNQFGTGFIGCLVGGKVTGFEAALNPLVEKGQDTDVYKAKYLLHLLFLRPQWSSLSYERHSGELGVFLQLYVQPS